MPGGRTEGKQPGKEKHRATANDKRITVNTLFCGIRTKMVGQISVELWIQGTKSARERLSCGPTNWRLHMY